MLGKIFGACLEVVWRFGETTSYIGTFRVKHHFLACHEVGPPMNRNSCSPLTIQTLPLSMHRKWKEITEFVRKTTNGKENPAGTNCRRKRFHWGKGYLYCTQRYKWSVQNKLGKEGIQELLNKHSLPPIRWPLHWWLLSRGQPLAKQSRSLQMLHSNSRSPTLGEPVQSSSRKRLPSQYTWSTAAS